MKLHDYLEQFRRLRINRSGGRASPHKVCMMYAVIDLVEEGTISRNEIYFDDQLERRYLWYFDQMKGKSDHPHPFYPFYRLRSDGFWHHQIKADQQARYEKSDPNSASFIRDVIAYAYLDDDLFSLMRNSSACAAMKQALAENLSNQEERFERWCVNIGKSLISVKSYINALKKQIPKLLRVQEDSLFLVSDYSRMLGVVQQSLQVQEFSTYNSRENGTLSEALKLYLSYLDELTRASVEIDVAIIQTDSSLEPTQKETLIQARRGQGKFRERLINQWQQCAVTGYSNLSLLIASHIKSWRDSNNRERIDPYNGLLLIPNLDKAFDLHYISFDDRGKILISEQLENYKLLGIHKDMSVHLTRDHQEYLEHHRDQFRRH